MATGTTAYAGFPSYAFEFDASVASSVVATAATQRVSQWNDLSSNGWNAAQATGGNQPLTGAALLNGRNVLRFDGSRFMTLAGALSWLNAVPGATLHVVGRERDDTTVDHSFFCGAFAGNTFRFTMMTRDQNDGALAPNNRGRRASGDGGVNSVRTLTNDKNWHIWSTTHDYPTGAMLVRMDGDGGGGSAATLASTSALSAATDMTSVTIGSTSHPTALIDGYIAHVIGYQAFHSVSDIASVVALLRRQWFTPSMDGPAQVIRAPQPAVGRPVLPWAL